MIGKVVNNEFETLTTALTQGVIDSSSQLSELETEVALELTKASLEIANTRAQDLMADWEKIRNDFNEEQEKSQYYFDQLETKKNSSVLLEAAVSEIKTLRMIEKDYTRTRKRLTEILDAPDDEILSTLVARILRLFVKAMEQNRLRQRKQQEESKALETLAKQHPVGKILLTLAKCPKIQFSHLAAVTRLNSVSLKYYLGKWKRQGAIEVTKDGWVRVLRKKNKTKIK
jgi:hypothetical protein